MYKKLAIPLVIVIICFMVYVGYMFGFYYGVSKSFLYSNVMEAHNNISTINYLHQAKLDKAIKILTVNLEVNMDAIKDINSNLSKSDHLIDRYTIYKQLLNYSREKYVNEISTKYKNFKETQVGPVRGE
jgi:hypothetical protein